MNLKLDIMKKDLKTGMIVETRNGEQWKVLTGVDTSIYGKDITIIAKNGGFVTIPNYEDDLTCDDNHDYDIMKVWDKRSERYILSIEEKGKLLWERQERLPEIELTLEDIAKLKGCKVEQLRIKE